MNVCTQNKKFRCLQKENTYAYTRKYIHPYKEITRLRNETHAAITRFFLHQNPVVHALAQRNAQVHNKFFRH